MSLRANFAEGVLCFPDTAAQTNGTLFSPRTPMIGAIPALRSTGIKPPGKHQGKFVAKDLCRMMDP